MALKGITVNTAPEAEAHVYAEDDAAIFQSMFGSDGVFEVGQECESQVISNNKVRIKDGVIIVGGHIARIPYGEYVDCEIANGQSGKKRNDIIIGKFTTTGSGGIDTMTCEVKQGAAVTGTAEDPELTQNDIYQGGKIREMPLYRIKLDGLSITGVEQMFDLIPSIPTLNASLADMLSLLSPEFTQIYTSANGTVHGCKIGKIAILRLSLSASESNERAINFNSAYAPAINSTSIQLSREDVLLEKAILSRNDNGQANITFKAPSGQGGTYTGWVTYATYA